MSRLRSAAGMKKSKPTRNFLDSYTIKGTEKVVKAGDCVVMRAQEVGKPPYIAKLEKIESDNRNHARVRVRWYYRPEESIGGRRQFHGSKEVFLSDHFDDQSADTIEGKCTVHTFKTYTKLESVGSEDYFCRFEYKAATGGFTPDRVAVYCKCEMPYNPDVLMAQCESCKDCVRSGAVMKKSKPSRNVLDSYTIKGTNTVVKAGDCVIMRAPEPGKPPYIAKVEKIESDNRKHAIVRVRWYYRPEEAIGGRRQFHGSKEVFLSDHFDEQSADTIEGKCTVHTFKTYIKLDSVGAQDYFCRFEYKAATGGFMPDRVAVYCKCELPYNPDVLMAQCEECKDWFHPPCMNLTAEQVKKMDHFFCSDCAEDGEKKPVNSVKDLHRIEQKEPEPKRRRLQRSK